MLKLEGSMYYMIATYFFLLKWIKDVCFKQIKSYDILRYWHYLPPSIWGIGPFGAVTGQNEITLKLHTKIKSQYNTAYHLILQNY